jgi:hypothetical protein
LLALCLCNFVYLQKDLKSLFKKTLENKGEVGKKKTEKKKNNKKKEEAKTPPRPTPFQTRSAPLLSSLPWLTNHWGPHVSVFFLLPQRTQPNRKPPIESNPWSRDFLAVLHEPRPYKASKYRSGFLFR